MLMLDCLLKFMLPLLVIRYYDVFKVEEGDHFVTEEVAVLRHNLEDKKLESCGEGLLTSVTA